jgi:hypothetical protein
MGHFWRQDPPDKTDGQATAAFMSCLIGTTTVQDLAREEDAVARIHDRRYGLQIGTVLEVWVRSGPNSGTAQMGSVFLACRSSLLSFKDGNRNCRSRDWGRVMDVFVSKNHYIMARIQNKVWQLWSIDHSIRIRFAFHIQILIDKHRSHVPLSCQAILDHLNKAHHVLLRDQ